MRVAAMAVLVLCGCGASQEDAAGPPDGDEAAPFERIILIVVDTLRVDHLGVYGSEIATPHIDRLAGKGMVFENAIANFHSTTMSMAALFSGRTPSIESGNREKTLEWNTFASCGLSRFSTPELDDACVPRRMEMLAEALRSAGYWTMGVTSNKLLYRPYGYDQGFDDWVEVGEEVPEGDLAAAVRAAKVRTANFVNEQVAQILARRARDRFFLYVHYIDVHDWLLHRKSYAESVRDFDPLLGAMLDSLEREGLLEDALLVFTSDHGEMLVDQHLHFRPKRHYGNPSLEPVLRVPLIVSPAGDEDRQAILRSQDVKDLILGRAGLASDPAEDLEAEELIVTEQLYQTYRKGHWKSIWERGKETPFLFDLSNDANELRDIAGAHPEVVESHRRRVEQLSVELAAPESHRRELDAEDRSRLRALGYLDDEDAVAGEAGGAPAP
jgi:arylsulfatase A-like enzyme